ncbi:MAG: GNAT family N-acetyltransferase [Nitrososphaeraceae archaeon]|nr:GNAT family N-acetyltransferase [Nitrososphaeraceae archaeon]
MENSFIFSHIETEDDFENYLKFIEVIWPGENVDAMARRIFKNLLYFTFNNIFIIKKIDRIVASLTLIPQTWCYGDVPIKVAEMGLVATLPEFRNIGLQRILNTEYDKVLMYEYYDFSVIEGIPYFYRQFG